MSKKINKELREYLKNKFPNYKEKKSFSILENLDSLDFYDFILFLERNFKIKLGDSDLVSKNLDKIENLVKLIEKKKAKK
jgi:acyl carrier protein